MNNRIINTNVTSKPLTLNQLAYKQTAAALRKNPDLTVSELIKINTQNYLDICKKSGKLPEQQIMKNFKYEMYFLKKTYDSQKNKIYTDEQRKRSLETRREARWTIIERILEMKAEGFSHKQIAEEIDIHVKTISRYLKELRRG